MAAVLDRRQLFADISRAIAPAKEALKLSPETKATAHKVVGVFGELYSSIAKFIQCSPRAFSDIAGGIGVAQNLLLEAAARLKDQPLAAEQLRRWEERLGDWRLSRAGQTDPRWLNSSDIGTGILLRWRPPSLDESDEGKPQKRRYIEARQI